MYNLDDLTVISELKLRLQSVTQEQIDILAKGFTPIDPECETSVGTVAETTRPLFVLNREARMEHNMQELEATALVDPRLVEDHKQRAVIAENIFELVKAMMWTQARFDTGYWVDGSVGIRENWTLVSIKDDAPSDTPSLPAALIALLKKIG